jgi:uncharacterized protein YcaQ
MVRAAPPAVPLSTAQARGIWLRAQRLDKPTPFGAGPEATRLAAEHLGYIQIDTINVIERCHHHILFARIPAYRRSDLHREQTIDKTVFEFWAHALCYLPVRDLPVYLRSMKHDWERRSVWFTSVTDADLRKVMRRLRRDGPFTIRDVDDDELVEKDHPWASRKPSKHALQLAFFKGLVTVSERQGMLKTYDLIERHFGWTRRPRPATDGETNAYLLERAQRTQGVVSLDSICFLVANRRRPIRELIDKEVRRKRLVPVAVEGAGKQEHWIRPEALEAERKQSELVHILSPFDPLIHQRQRLKLFFGYEHIFEAYVPKPKRRFGYFALPVLVDQEIVAAIDLKADRANRKLLVQQWTWVGKGTARNHKRRIEEALGNFERFQLAPAQTDDA